MRLVLMKSEFGGGRVVVVVMVMVWVQVMKGRGKGIGDIAGPAISNVFVYALFLRAYDVSLYLYYAAFN